MSDSDGTWYFKGKFYSNVLILGLVL
ncbi:LCI family antimicrobial peptide [Bacillus licheniformis]|nr:LCI family antimicrobial peptide [Bacillus licheniformis]